MGALGLRMGEKASKSPYKRDSLLKLSDIDVSHDNITHDFL